MSAIAEIVLEAIGYAVTEGWEGVTRATHDRFGWLAATIVAWSPIVILGLIIWLTVLSLS